MISYSNISEYLAIHNAISFYSQDNDSIIGYPVDELIVEQRTELKNLINKWLPIMIDIEAGIINVIGSGRCKELEDKEKIFNDLTTLFVRWNENYISDGMFAKLAVKLLDKEYNHIIHSLEENQQC